MGSANLIPGGRRGGLVTLDFDSGRRRRAIFMSSSRGDGILLDSSQMVNLLYISL
jgi:hypothetical protein